VKLGTSASGENEQGKSRIVDVRIQRGGGGWPWTVTHQASGDGTGFVGKG